MKREGEDKERLEVNVGRSVRIPFCTVSTDMYNLVWSSSILVQLQYASRDLQVLH